MFCYNQNNLRYDNLQWRQQRELYGLHQQLQLHLRLQSETLLLSTYVFIRLAIQNVKELLPLSVVTGRCRNFPSCMMCRASTIGVSTVVDSGF